MYKLAVGLFQILSLALILGFYSNLAAQSAAKTAAGNAANAAVKNDREPFEIGETLTYEAKWSRAILRGIDVADLNFKVAKPPADSAKNAKFLLQGEAVSKGSLMKIFRFSFLQKIDSTVDGGNFRILQTVRHDKQNERVRDGEARFDYQSKKVIYREVDPNNPARPPRLISSTLDAPVYDLLSAIYFLRMQPLKVGETIEIRVSDSGVIYRIPIKVAAREQIKTVLGKVWTLRLEPEVFGEKGVLPDEGKMILWFTDDARRLPVRSQIQSPVGRIEIKLKQAQNLIPAS